MLKDNQFTVKGFIVWGICALFFLYEFFLRTVIGTFQHPVMEDLQLTSVQFSLLSTTTFLFFYGIMQIPVGLIIDHIGLKKSLSIGAALCAIASICFAYSYNYPIAIFYRILMGFGASFGFICLLVAVHDWMPYRYNAIFIGLSQFMGTIGPMLAAGPLDTLAETTNINWRLVFLYLGLMGCVLLFLVILFVENNQQKAGKYIILCKPEKIKVSIIRLFVRLQPWFIAIFSASIYFTVEYLSENEGRNFIKLKGLNSNTASYMITVAWIGYALGCPCLGFLSDFSRRRVVPMILAACCNFIAIVMIMFAANKNFLLGSFFLLGLGAGGQSIGFATIAEQFKKQFVAVGFGLNNMMITVISVINAPLIGWLLDCSRAGACITLKNYYFAFSVLIVVATLSLIFSIFCIRETYCKSRVDFTYL